MGKTADYHANPKWVYLGDVNAANGGIWIQHNGDYCDAIEVTDLDSATGFTGPVIIERRTASLSRSFSENRKRIKSALASCGWTIRDMPETAHSKEAKRALIWEALIRYGYGDCETLEILQLEPDGPMQSRNGRKADRRQTGGDIGGYVMAKYLD